MKKHLLTLIMGIVFTQTLFAQTFMTMPTGTATTSPSNACLSCPGSGWNNEMNVTVSDGIAADVNLMKNAFCFQSTCYYSRSLVSSQFGFSIPGSATILGIEVNIIREAPAINTIMDTTVMLLMNGVTQSLNNKSSVSWPATYTNQVYGGPSNLWGLTWTPADINNPATAVRLGVYNQSTVSVSGVNVDFISMTVYYANPLGIIESQTSSPNVFSPYPNPSENILNIENISNRKIEMVTVFDIMGRKVLEQRENTSQVNVQSLEKGMYQLVIISNGKNYSWKFVKE
ncbi:MAG TPA: T9SS type A sorting domain-containing protein [Bacteroidia bacterium]|nr:T9SS type A sorting domain-containing protein [Bacteroidia bacterium]